MGMVAWWAVGGILAVCVAPLLGLAILGGALGLLIVRIFRWSYERKRKMYMSEEQETEQLLAAGMTKAEREWMMKHLRGTSLSAPFSDQVQREMVQWRREREFKAGVLRTVKDLFLTMMALLVVQLIFLIVFVLAVKGDVL